MNTKDTVRNLIDSIDPTKVKCSWCYRYIENKYTTRSNNGNYYCNIQCAKLIYEAKDRQTYHMRPLNESQTEI